MRRNYKVLCYSWIGTLGRDVAMTALISAFSWVLQIIIRIASNVAHSLSVTFGPSGAKLASQPDGPSSSDSSALANAIDALQGLPHALLGVFWLMVIVIIIRITIAMIRHVHLVQSFRLSGYLQRSLVSTIEVANVDNNDLLSTILKASQKSQKKAIRSMKSAYVVLAEDSYIVVPLPSNYRAQQLVINSADVVVNDVASIANKRVSAPDKINVGFLFYQVYRLN